MLQLVGRNRGGLRAARVPGGRPVVLPGRGTTFVYDAPGPPGAPTLVLLHGLGATAALNWLPAFRPLSARYPVVALDQRGHGRGIPVRGRFRLADCADDVAALADALAIERFVPVGYSMGGSIGQLIWHRHPERVEGMVLCATSRNFGGSLYERWFFAGLAGAALAIELGKRLPRPRAAQEDAATFEQRLGALGLPRWAIGELRRCDRGALLEALWAVGRFSSHRWIDRVDVPTAVVVTTRDTAISPSRQLKLARAIPGATVHPAPADHTACVLGARRFVPALLEACESVAARIPTQQSRMTAHQSAS